MSKSTRHNIVVPDDRWEAYKRAAKRKGLTVAKFLIESADQQLPDSETRKFSDLRNQGRPVEDNG